MISIFVIFLGGCDVGDSSSDTGLDELFPWADEVIAAEGDASWAVNGARGLGEYQGSTDVYSLDFDANHTLIVGWSSARLTDGPGIDLVVFENPFEYADGEIFIDPVVVGVSADGVDFVDFPFAFEGPNPDEWSSDPRHWTGFAGKTPVLLNEDTNPTDPFEVDLSGGDGFDFSDLPSGDPVADDVRDSGAVAVRLTAWSRLKHPVGNGADIDAVYGRYLSR
jgi:hypothetical protein